MSSSLRVFLGICLLVMLLVCGVVLFRPDLFRMKAGGEDGQPAQVAKQEAAQRPAMVVTAKPPKMELLPVRLAADGEVVAWQEASVASESNSLTLSEVLVNVGDRVKKGQVLARFNGRTVAEDVTQAKVGTGRGEGGCHGGAGQCPPGTSPAGYRHHQ